MKFDLYTVENPMVYNKNEKNVVNLSFTQKIHENRDPYEYDNKQDDPASMIQSFFIDTVFVERVHQLAYKKVMADSKFRDAEEGSSRLFSQLKESLSTAEQKELLLELESEWDRKYGIFLEYSYCQGLADSPMIHKELEKYGISVVKETTKDNYSFSCLTC